VIRRVSIVDLMLLGTIVLWALNVTVTRYALTHGFRPLAYAALRYCGAATLFWAFTWRRERSFRIRLSDSKLVALAALLIFVNQVCFVVSVHETNASTVALMLGAIPIFAAVFASLVGVERVDPQFWIAAVIVFIGVGLVAGGSGDGFSGNLGGDALAVGTAATWAGYSVAIAPLMQRYSPFRISALVLALGWVPLAVVSIPQLSSQDFGFDWTVWLVLAFAIVGPLFFTNILWFTAIDRVGPSRASLFSTFQAFLSVFFALLLLGERLSRWEILGGVAIAAGIVLERVRSHEPAVAVE